MLLPPFEMPAGSELAIAASELSRSVRRAFDRRARALGYTQYQWRVLLMLAKAQGCSQAALAEKLEMQPIAVARILDRMEQSGLVERQRDPDDRRAVKLFLAEGAGPIMKQLHAIAEEVMGLVRDGVSPERQAEVAQLLQAMRANLERADSTSSAKIDRAG
jgi:MarR family transcriptional regulator for hemolysin